MNRLYIVWMDGRLVYRTRNYDRAKAYALNLRTLYRNREIIVTMDGLIVGI